MVVVLEGNVAREDTEGPCKPGSDRRRFSEAGEEGSRRHACRVRLRPHTRGGVFGREPQASDRRDERRATRPYACQWPPRAYRPPAGPTCRPELARVGSGTNRILSAAGTTRWFGFHCHFEVPKAPERAESHRQADLHRRYSA